MAFEENFVHHILSISNSQVLGSPKIHFGLSNPAAAARLVLLLLRGRADPPPWRKYVSRLPPHHLPPDT